MKVGEGDAREDFERMTKRDFSSLRTSMMALQNEVDGAKEKFSSGEYKVFCDNLQCVHNVALKLFDELHRDVRVSYLHQEIVTFPYYDGDNLSCEAKIVNVTRRKAVLRVCDKFREGVDTDDNDFMLDSLNNGIFLQNWLHMRTPVIRECKNGTLLVIYEIDFS